MFLCFALSIFLIFPLYNINNKNLLSFDGISEIYYVENVGGKEEYIKKESFSFVEFQKAEGVIVIFDKNVSDVVKTLDVKLIKRENIDGTEVLYGYTNLFGSFVYIDGKQSNVQIVERQNKTIAGFPLILSGF